MALLSRRRRAALTAGGGERGVEVKGGGGPGLVRNLRRAYVCCGGAAALRSAAAPAAVDETARRTAPRDFGVAPAAPRRAILRMLQRCTIAFTEERRGHRRGRSGLAELGGCAACGCVAVWLTRTQSRLGGPRASGVNRRAVRARAHARAGRRLVQASGRRWVPLHRAGIIRVLRPVCATRWARVRTRSIACRRAESGSARTSQT